MAKARKWIQGGNQSTDTKIAAAMVKQAQRCVVGGDDIGALEAIKCALSLLPIAEEVPSEN